MVSPLASINTPFSSRYSPVYFTLFHHSSLLGYTLTAVLLFIQPLLVYRQSTQQHVFPLVGLVIQQPKLSKVTSAPPMQCSLLPTPSLTSITSLAALKIGVNLSRTL